MRPHHTRSSGTATFVWWVGAPNSTTITEGTTYTYYVQTTGVSNGTTLYWSIAHGTTTNADFSANSGSFTVNNNLGIFNLSPTNDGINDGGETFTLTIRTESISGPIVLSRNITVNNIPPSYSLNMHGYGPYMESNNYDYGLYLYGYNLGTTSSITVYWKINHITTNDNDFNRLNDSVTLYWNGQHHAYTSQFGFISDNVSEGDEYFNIELYTDCLHCTLVYTSDTYSVRDPNTCTPYLGAWPGPPTGSAPVFSGPAYNYGDFYENPNYIPGYYTGEGYIFYHSYYFYINEATDQFYASFSSSPDCSTLASGWYIGLPNYFYYGTTYANEFTLGNWTGNTVEYTVTNNKLNNLNP